MNAELVVRDCLTLAVLENGVEWLYLGDGWARPLQQSDLPGYVEPEKKVSEYFVEMRVKTRVDRHVERAGRGRKADRTPPAWVSQFEQGTLTLADDGAITQEKKS